jgi:hypothetical protein
LVQNEPEKKSEGVIGASLVGQDTETPAKNLPKNHVVEPQHQQRGENGPDDAEVTAAVA